MTENGVSEVGDAISDTVSTTVTEAAQSSGNIFKTIAGALGIDISQISLIDIAVSVLLLVVLIGVSKLISKLCGKAVKRSRMSESLKRFIERAIKFTLYFLSVMIFADSIGIPITSLVAVFSLFGLAISLSIQKLLGNVMSGVSLLMLKPFEVGDYIETEVAGTVHSIGLFYTEIVTVDNKRVFIPNEIIVSSTLTNYTSETNRRIDIQVNAAYQCEIEKVKAAIAEAVESIPELLDDPEPIIGVAEFGDSAIIYDVRAWATTKDFLKAKYALMEAISSCYKKHGIEMAYNRLEVELLPRKK